MVSKLMSLLQFEDGATAIEYALLAGLIAVAVLTVIANVGSNLNSTFQAIGINL
jgi:pilus assembly protein Flp/PilA